MARKVKTAPKSSSTIRQARLVADAVAVCCPYCGEPQPNPVDGSEQWDKGHFRAYDDRPRKKCVACDEEMFVFSLQEVAFP